MNRLYSDVAASFKTDRRFPGLFWTHYRVRFHWRIIAVLRVNLRVADNTARWRSLGIESRGRPFARSHHIGYVGIMKSDDLITVDSEILGGTPVFKGTRVPVKTLFDYLEENYTLEEFLACFPSVTREMACRILERSETALLSKS